MQCLGITKQRKRCKNSCTFLFCKKHFSQPFLLIFGILTFIGVIAGLYQDVWKEFNDRNISQENISEGVFLENIYLTPVNSSLYGSWGMKTEKLSNERYNFYLDRWKQKELNTWLDLNESKYDENLTFYNISWSSHKNVLNKDGNVSNWIKDLAYKNGYEDNESDSKSSRDFGLLFKAFEYIGGTKSVQAPQLNLVIRNDMKKHITLLEIGYDSILSTSSGAGAGAEQVKPIDLNQTLIIDFYDRTKNKILIHPPIVIEPSYTASIQFNIHCKNAGRADGPGDTIITLWLKYSTGQDIKILNLGNFRLYDTIEVLLPEYWLY